MQWKRLGFQDDTKKNIFCTLFLFSEVLRFGTRTPSCVPTEDLYLGTLWARLESPLVEKASRTTFRRRYDALVGGQGQILLAQRYSQLLSGRWKARGSLDPAGLGRIFFQSVKRGGTKRQLFYCPVLVTGQSGTLIGS